MILVISNSQTGQCVHPKVFLIQNGMGSEHKTAFCTELNFQPHFHLVMIIVWLFRLFSTLLKGHLRSKKKLSSNERAWKMQKRAINDLNAPNGSRDISFQSQEFGQDGHRHFVGFQPHFHLNMTSQTQYFKTMKKWKWNISGVFCLICLKLCRL